MKTKHFWYLLITASILFGGMLGVRAAQAASQDNFERSNFKPAVEDLTPAWDSFEKSLTAWESDFTTPGWVRLTYTEKSGSQLGIAVSPEVQYPGRAQVEIWFHFNENRLVDQEIDFFNFDSEKKLSGIIYNQQYRGLSEKFAPQDQQPYAPSLSFYLTAVSPAMAAEEKVLMDVKAADAILDNQLISQFSITSTFPEGYAENSGYGANITGMINVATLDPNTGALLAISTYRMDANKEARLTHEISGIKVEAAPSLPPEIQWYFDHYDQLDWETYSSNF